MFSFLPIYISSSSLSLSLSLSLSPPLSPSPSFSLPPSLSPSLPLPLSPPHIQLYMYQLFRSLAYIHANGVCHRDIKPQNLLLNPETGILKLCDFGRYSKIN